MEPIKKKYIVDEQGRRVAVQVGLETFEQIEEVLENYALYQLMQQTAGDEVLDLKEAQAFYRSLPKAE